MKKCPKCNEIFRDFAGVNLDTCPKCNVDLDTGLKIEEKLKRPEPKEEKKIKIYGWVRIAFIFITIWSALSHMVGYLMKNGKLDTVSTIDFFANILLSPYLWVALILSWRIDANKKKLKKVAEQDK